MRAIAAPADKRFRRVHVKPGRRRSWRSVVRPSLKYAVLALLTTVVMYRGSAVVANAPLLQIDRLAVSGNQWLSTADVNALLDGLYGENIIWADLDFWRRRVMASPWVRDAALRRSLPATVEVVVFERSPVCIARIGGSLYLVDERGTVLAPYGPQYSEFDLPIVDGLAPQGSREAAADPARAELAARVIAEVAADAAVAAQLSQVNVTDPHNVSVILSGDPAVLYVGTENFLPRLRSYIQMAAAVRERVPNFDYADLRFDEHIVVGPSRNRR
jgi:cell division protein FtsQ